MSLATQPNLPAHAVGFQKWFALGDPKFRPVVDLNGAMAILDLDALQVDDLLSSGLLIAFNIAVEKLARRELRFLCASLDHYKKTSTAQGLEFETILKFLLPHDKPVLTNSEIQRSLNCGSHLIIDLVKAGELALAPKTVFRRGNGGEAIITAQSFCEFVGGRQLGETITIADCRLPIADLKKEGRR